MTRDDLIKKLNEMYFNAKDKETAAMIHLFGIKYADFLREHGSLKKLAHDASIPVSYAIEINKGINLAKFVDIKSDINL